MKTSTKCLLVVPLLLAGCGIGDTAEIDLGGTRLCYPSRYTPGFNLTIWLMTRGVPDSGEEVRILIPAAEIREQIPAYTLSHATQYNPAFEHEIYGIARSKASWGDRDLADAAWRIAAVDHDYFVVPDEANGFWRIYEHFNPSFMWHLVASPPPDSPQGGGPPDDWYIGHCLEMSGGYQCDQFVMSDSVVFDYHLDMRDLHLRGEVASLLRRKLHEWETACEQ